MTIDRPRVSIGLPVYNGEKYLAGAFESLLAQDYPHLEIIVSDNASTDRTWEICTYYGADPRVRLYRNDENKGASYNYNRLVELARGELFRWQAYDDLCAPTLVSRCVEALDEAGPGTVLSYPRTVIIDGDGNVTGPFDDGLDLADRRSWRRVSRFVGRFNLCNAAFGLTRIDMLRRTGLLRPFPSSDVTLLAELAAIGQFREVPEELFFRRIHAESSVQGRGSSKEARAQVAAWFDPRKRNSVVAAPRLQLTIRTAKALLSNDSGLSGSARLASVAAFATTYGARRARVVAGRARRTVLRKPPTQQPSSQ